VPVTLIDWLTDRRSVSHFTADSQSVCLGVEPTLWTFARYCFLFKSLGLEFAVLSLWGALSDDRQGLSFYRVRVTLRLTVCQYVLVSSPLCGRLTRYCFLFKSLGMEFVLLSLWGALSDERLRPSFVSQSQSHFTADSQSVSMSWCRAHFVDV
jgi:hypothetical protein